MRRCGIFGVLGVVLMSAAWADGHRDGVYIIYDSSNSMWGALPDDSRKYEAARTAMRELAGEDFGGRDVALRMYGHRRKDDCTDSELVVPWSDPGEVGAEIVSTMEAVRPTGRTPIDRSLRAALQDFGDRKGTIILISDGVESCDADPCALVREWQDRKVGITVHVVGLGLRGKERLAMQCIAEAAGTEYRDAFSAEELIAGLGAVVEVAAPSEPLDAGEPDPQPQVAEAAVRLDVVTPDGVARRGRAAFTPVGGGEVIMVDSDGRHMVAAGDYVVSAGVLTIDGEIYRPVEREVTVGFDGADMTVVINDAVKPPEVSARFSMGGEAIRETVVTAYIGGEKVGSFHGDATAFVPESSIEFRSTLAGSSEELSVVETFEAGDVKEISFEALTEVRLVVNLHLGDSGQRLLSKPALDVFQNGESVGKLNRRSGGLIRPGAYVVKADDGLMTYEQEIVVSADGDQTMDIVLPAGALSVVYQDASGLVEAPKRVFIYPESGRGGVTRQSDEEIALMPGTYLVEGHPKRAEYPLTRVTIAEGETTTVTLRATKAP